MCCLSTIFLGKWLSEFWLKKRSVSKNNLGGRIRFYDGRSHMFVHSAGCEEIYQGGNFIVDL